MEPYQEATEESLRQSAAPFKSAAYLGGAVLGSGAILGRIAPLLSKFVPWQTAAKGLSKVDNRLGKFISSAEKMGYSADEIRNFMGEKIEEKKGSNDKNIIKQYSPELHEYIAKEIGKGRSPLEAGALASTQDSFKKIIKKLSEDHKAPFASIIETVYGTSQKPQQSELSRAALTEQFNQGQPQGEGKSALLNTMQEITQALSRMRNG